MAHNHSCLGGFSYAYIYLYGTECPIAFLYV